MTDAGLTLKWLVPDLITGCILSFAGVFADESTAPVRGEAGPSP